MDFESSSGMAAWKRWVNETFPRLQYHCIHAAVNNSCDPGTLFQLGRAPGEAGLTEDGTPSLSGFFLDTVQPAGVNITSDMSAASLIFGSRYETGVWMTSCGLTTSYVISNISCQGTVSSRTPCVVEGMQLDPDPPLPRNFSFLQNSVSTPANMFKLFPTATDDPDNIHPDQSSLTEAWVGDPPSALRAIPKNELQSVGDLPIEVFQERFALLLNTYWRAGVNPYVVLGQNFDDVVPDPFGGQPIINVTARWQFSVDPVYTVDAAWLAVFWIANMITLAAAVAGLFFKLRCRAPQIFGFVTPLIYESPYFSRSLQEGSTLSVGTHIRALRDLRVRVGDVQRDADIGRIAFGEEVRVAGLRDGRRHG